MKSVDKVLLFVISISFIISLSSKNLFGQMHLEKRQDYKNVLNGERAHHLKNHMKVKLSNESDHVERNNFINLLKMKKSMMNGVVLDSVIYYTRFGDKLKATFTYDENGKWLTWFEELWDADSGQWVNYRRFTSTYDGSGNLLTFLWIYWDTESEQWVNSQRYTYTYDDNGNLLTDLFERWDSDSGQWMNYVRYTYTYDHNGNTLSEFGERWDSDSGQWVNYDRIIYTYDSKGNELTKFWEYWDSQWVNFRQYSATYDGRGNELTYLEQRWDRTTGQWSNYMLYTNTYDSDDNWLIWLDQRWDADAGQWVNEMIGTSTFDDKGNELTLWYEVWDIDLGEWVNRWFKNATYDIMGNELTKLWELWDTVLSQWGNYERHTSTFDGNGNKLTYLLENWKTDKDPAYWREFIREAYTFDSSGYLTSFIGEVMWSWGVDWEPYRKSIIFNDNFNQYDFLSCELYVYYGNLTGIDNKNPDLLKRFKLTQNYPNPFNPSTTISYSLPKSGFVVLTVYDILGNEVQVLVNEYKNADSYSVKFDASDLSSGLYFYKLNIDGLFIEAKKMMLMR